MPVFNKMVYNGTEYILWWWGNIWEPVLHATWTANSATIRWTDWDDINTIPPSTFDHAVLVRKIGSAPTSPSDWDVVETETVKNTYSSIGFTDTGLTTWTSYFYNVFCYSTTWWISYGTPVEATPWILEWPDIDKFSLAGSYTGYVSWLHSIWCSYDGTKLYIGRNSAYLSQYTLLNAEISNFIDSTESSISYQSRWLWCWPNWTKLYNSIDSEGVYETTMATPYSLTWSSTTTNSLVSGTCWVSLSYDWLKMYVWIWGTPHTFYEYNLSTAFDVSTHDNWVAHTVDVIVSTGNIDGAFIYQTAISPSGKKMYFSADQWHIYQYDLSTPYDWSTATYYGELNTWLNWRLSLWFLESWSRFFAGNIDNKYLYQFDAS